MAERCCCASRSQDRFAVSGGVLFHRRRSPLLVEHQLCEMLSQRIYGLALGYEDLNDHEQLRRDPLMACWPGAASWKIPWPVKVP